MKKFKKALVLFLCAVLLVAGSVAGTLAYLQAKSEVVQNTFTVGDVKIDLDEANVDEYGDLADLSRVKSNKYKLLPGHDYIKDPTVTVKANSEDCYVRMFVSVNEIEKLKAAFPVAKYPTFYAGELFLLQMLVTGWDNAVWEYEDYNNGTYEFRYHEIVRLSSADVRLDALFDTIVIPGTVTNTELASLNAVQIDVVAQAIQADGFDTADKAWAQWNSEQMESAQNP